MVEYLSGRVIAQRLESLRFKPCEVAKFSAETTQNKI